MSYKELLKKANIDLKETRTKVILGATVAGAAVLGGWGLYSLLSTPTEKETSENVKEEVKEDKVTVSKEAPSISNFTPPKELSPVDKADKKKAEGNNNFKKSKYSEALTCYKEAVDLYPSVKFIEKSHCYQNMAAVSDKLGNIGDVIMYCSKALELNKKYIKALQRRATAYEKQKELAKSIKDWTAVCLIEGPEKSFKAGYMDTSDRVLKEYGKEKAKEIFTSRKPVMPSLSVIKAAFDNIHFRDFLTDTTAESLENEGDRLYIEVLNLIQGEKFTEAFDKLNEALKLLPNKFLTQCLCLRGIYAWVMTDYKKAQQCFDDVITNKDSYLRIKVQALIHRGEVSQALGNKDRAFMDYNSAVGLDEDHPDPYLHRAQFYLSLEKLVEAVADLNKCVALDPDFASPWQQLVYAKYQMARTINPSLLQDVYDMLDEMIAKFPTVSDMYALYGQVLQDQRQFVEADVKFQKAAELSPNNVAYMGHRATLKMMAENNYEGAYEILIEARSKDPKCDFVLETLGMIYIQKQMYKEALECFDEVLKLTKSEGEAAHYSALFIGVKCQWEVCEELDVKPISMTDMQSMSGMQIPQ